MDKLLSLNVRTMKKLIGEGTLSYSELMRTCLQRAEHVNELNCFITLLSDEALETSRALENDSNPSKPLKGVPVAIKDNFCTKNVRTTCASKMLENFVPPYDATIVSKLKNAGAVIIGKTNLDQFAMGSGTVDSIFGPTMNVWGSVYDNNRPNDSDEWRIAGGSSGGSAVAVASGICIAAIGSDTGGSTRNPAALCGLVGLKPTYGTVSRYGLIPLVNSMDVPGILTRNVDDCATVYACIAGHDRLDSTTIQHDTLNNIFNNIENTSIKNLKIGVPDEYLCDGASDEIKQALREVADLLDNEGAIVKRISMPHTSASIVVYSILNQCEVASNMARYDGLEYGLRASGCSSTHELYATSRSQGFNSVVKNRILAGNYFLLTRNYENYFIKALKIRRLITNDFKRAFDSVRKNCVNILLTPTVLNVAPYYHDYIKLDNRDQCAVHDYCTQPANMAGVPAISIPIKLSRNNLPVSLQLMGPNFSEHLLFRVAKRIEQLVNFPKFDIKTKQIS